MADAEMPPPPPPPPPLTLQSLPEDMLRRVVDTVDAAAGAAAAAGAPPPTPLRTAHILAAVSRQLRRYVVENYLPSVTALGHADWAPLVGGDSAAAAAAAAAVEALLGRCTGLKKFSSEGSQGLVTSSAVRAMAECAADTLEDVDIKYIDVADDAIRPLFGCKNLTRLQLSFGRAVTRDVFEFGDRATITAPLRYLDLTWLPCVDRNAVRHIAQISTLQELYLKNCEHFDNACARTLAEGEAAQSLTVLSVCYCPISNETLQLLVQSMPNLVKLLFAERPGSHSLAGAYDQRGIGEAKEKFPNVEFVFDT
jgi:hypothetical protein